MLEFNATFLISILSFVIFIFIMNSIFYKPILSIIRKRNEYINSNVSEFKLLTERNEKQKIYIDETLRNAKIESASAASNSLEKIKKISQDKLNTNRVAVNLKIQAQKTALYESKDSVIKELEGNIKNLSDVLTNKLMEN